MKWFGLGGTNVIEKSLNIKRGFSLHLDLFFATQECTYGIGLWPAKSSDVQQYSALQVEKQNESAGDGRTEVPPPGDHFLHFSLQKLLLLGIFSVFLNNSKLF